MLRCTLLVALLGLTLAGRAVPQAVEGAEGIASFPERPLIGRGCPHGAPEASCAAAHPIGGDAQPSRPERGPLPVPEPPEWMVWLCGIAVAAVIALRRLRGDGLSE
jgi:hypothetical protein